MQGGSVWPRCILPRGGIFRAMSNPTNGFPLFSKETELQRMHVRPDRAFTTQEINIYVKLFADVCDFASHVSNSPKDRAGCGS